jgi:hypothetical protein
MGAGIGALKPAPGSLTAWRPARALSTAVAPSPAIRRWAAAAAGRVPSSRIGPTALVLFVLAMDRGRGGANNPTQDSGTNPGPTPNAARFCEPSGGAVWRRGRSCRPGPGAAASGGGAGRAGGPPGGPSPAAAAVAFRAGTLTRCWLRERAEAVVGPRGRASKGRAELPFTWVRGSWSAGPCHPRAEQGVAEKPETRLGKGNKGQGGRAMTQGGCDQAAVEVLRKVAEGLLAKGLDRNAALAHLVRTRDVHRLNVPDADLLALLTKPPQSPPDVNHESQETRTSGPGAARAARRRSSVSTCPGSPSCSNGRSPGPRRASGRRGEETSPGMIPLTGRVPGTFERV